MKILVVTDKMYPDEYGGSCTVAYELIREWQKENKVDIYTCKRTDTSNDGLFLGNVIRGLVKKNPIKTILTLRKIIANEKYDVIITHSVISWMYLYMANNNIYSIRNIYSVFHGPWHKEAKLKYIGQRKYIHALIIPALMMMIEKIYCKYNKNLIFLSKYMKNELMKIGKVNADNIKYIPGGVRLESYSRKYDKNEAKKFLNITEDKYVLFTLRRLDKRMGIDRLIEAIKEMDEQIRSKIILVIGGKGGYRPVLEKIAEPIKDNIIFAGFIPDAELNKYFCASDLFVVPTLDLEGFGLVNLESLAMGVPVLATPQGGMLELEEKFDNFSLCKSNSVVGIKAAIIERMKKGDTEIIFDNLAPYDWSNIAKQYIKVFCE